MLDVLRRNAGSWLIKAILGFIALTFVSWGVFVGFDDKGIRSAATVGKDAIPMSELDQAAASIEKSYREVYGAAFTPEMQKALRIREQALDSLIQKRLLLEEAKRMGLSASDEEVQRDIAATPSFQENGQFREDRYRSLLAYNRVSPSEYEEQKRDEITLRKIDGLFREAARVTETDARDRFETANRKVRLLVAAADPASFRDVPAPTDGEIAARYATDKEKYRTPARVRIAVARFEPSRFGGDAAPSDEEVRAFHEANIDRFRTEEERSVSRVILPYSAKNRDEVRKKAEEMLGEANKGKDAFVALSKKPGAKGGDLTLTRKGKGPAAVTEAAFGAPVDTVAGPVDAGDSWQLVRVNRIRFPEPLPLAQVRDQVVALLRSERGRDIVVVKAYEARGKAASGGDLKAVAASYGVPVAETGWLDDKETGDLPPTLVQEALSHPANEVGPVKSLGDSHYLFKVVERQDSKIPPMTELRDRIAAVLRAGKQSAAAAAAARKALAGAKSAQELERAARSGGLAVATTAPFNPLSGELPEPLRGVSPADRKSFATLGVKSPLLANTLEAGGRYLAVAFVEEQAASPDEWAGRKEAFVRELVEKRRANLLESYIASRMKEVRVKKNPEAVK